MSNTLYATVCVGIAGAVVLLVGARIFIPAELRIGLFRLPPAAFDYMGVGVNGGSNLWWGIKWVSFAVTVASLFLGYASLSISAGLRIAARSGHVHSSNSTVPFSLATTDSWHTPSSPIEDVVNTVLWLKGSPEVRGWAMTAVGGSFSAFAVGPLLTPVSLPVVLLGLVFLQASSACCSSAGPCARSGLGPLGIPVIAVLLGAVFLVVALALLLSSCALLFGIVVAALLAGIVAFPVGFGTIYLGLQGTAATLMFGALNCSSPDGEVVGLESVGSCSFALASTLWIVTQWLCACGAAGYFGLAHIVVRWSLEELLTTDGAEYARKIEGNDVAALMRSMSQYMNNVLVSFMLATAQEGNMSTSASELSRARAAQAQQQARNDALVKSSLPRVVRLLQQELSGSIQTNANSDPSNSERGSAEAPLLTGAGAQDDWEQQSVESLLRLQLTTPYTRGVPVIRGVLLPHFVYLQSVFALISAAAHSIRPFGPSQVADFVALALSVLFPLVLGVIGARYPFATNFLMRTSLVAASFAAFGTSCTYIAATWTSMGLIFFLGAPCVCAVAILWTALRTLHHQHSRGGDDERLVFINAAHFSDALASHPPVIESST
jgi:hypothetical protein